jgi:hypothetical protein
MIITLISSSGQSTTLDTVDSKYVININDLIYTKDSVTLFSVDSVEYELVKSYDTKTGRIEFFGVFNRVLPLRSGFRN